MAKKQKREIKIAESKLPKLEKGFTIANIVMVALSLIPIAGDFIFAIWFFIPTLAFAIYNFVVSKGTNRRQRNLIILIMICISLVPFLGWVARVVALILSLITIFKK